jgi:hypothetical protein
MSRKVRSARGEVVDFDMLAIKQQLASIPAPVGVSQRRKFVDDKDGFKVKTVKQQPESSALQVAIDSAAASAASATRRAPAKKFRDS